MAEQYADKKNRRSTLSMQFNISKVLESSNIFHFKLMNIAQDRKQTRNKLLSGKSFSNIFLCFFGELVSRDLPVTRCEQLFKFQHFSLSK